MKKLAIIASVMMAPFALAAPVSAAGSDPVPVVKCKKGKVYSDSLGRCVRKTSQLLTDEEKFASAHWKAKRGEYAEARALLETIENKNQAKVLNYIGYTTRKMGDVSGGLRYYRQALAIDPNYVKAREYMGEGFLQKGDLASAKLQLSEIGARCGTGCSEYTQLSNAIAAYEKTGSFASKSSY